MRNKQRSDCKDAEVFVIENACACVTPESHKTAIEAMKMIQVGIKGTPSC